jgi:biopolymer transport protein ExbD
VRKPQGRACALACEEADMIRNVEEVLFNLLIFFLLATSLQQTEREMQIALPQAAAAGPITSALRELVINVDAQGKMIMSGRAVAEDELLNTIRTAVATNPGQKVSVRGDRTAPYEFVARALDICKGAGVSEPYLETIPTN